MSKKTDAAMRGLGATLARVKESVSSEPFDMTHVEDWEYTEVVKYGRFDVVGPDNRVICSVVEALITLTNQ